MAQETTCPAISLYPPSPNVSAPSLILTTPDTLHRDSIDTPPSSSPIFPVTGAVKTLCNRGAAIVSIHLAEPVLYVTGFEPQEYQDRSPALLRGSLLLKLLKPTKIKAITLVFRGRARTEWPEGIPPKKCEFFEEKELMTHTWPFFNAQFTSAEYSHGADAARLIDSQRSSTDITRVSMDSVSGVSLSDSQSSRSITPVGSPMLNANSQNGTWGIPFGQSSSKDEKTQAQVKGYRIFAAGEYVYNFELPLNSDLPESLECDLGSVRYELEATVERAGAFKSNLSGRTEVLLVRNPAEQNLETYEPIAITRTWEDQLHYEILISGKAFPLNGVIPIAFKFTPLAKVRLHRIKVYLTENVEYFCRDKKVHRFEPMRKLLLFEKAAQKSNGETTPRPTGRQNSIPSVNATDNGISIAGSRTASANSLGPITRLTRPGLGRHSPPKDDISAHSLLGNLEGGDGISSEFELDVKLPGCQSVRTPLDPKNKNSPLIPVKFHHGTIWPNLVVHHWIKIVLRISKADETRDNHGKRRHFEISIDSPIHLLSCRSQANTYLPAYTNPSSIPDSASDPAECQCVRERQERNQPAVFVPNSTAPIQSPPLHIQRPLHLMRQPSINPPSFYDDVAPPPLLTPPPNYDDLTPRVEERGGYFINGSRSGSDADEEVEHIEHITESDVAVPQMHEEHVEEAQDIDDDMSFMEGDIVDMVGLEDLSLNVGNHARRRTSSDPMGIWA